MHITNITFDAMWVQLTLALIIGICYGVVFGVPKRALITSGVAGAIGWLGYIAVVDWSGNIIVASLVGGICVALIAELSAHVQKFPVSVVAVPGIVLLVTGGMAYDAMKAMINGDYTTGFGLFIKTLLMAGAITMGLFLTGAWMDMTKSSLGKGADAQKIVKKTIEAGLILPGERVLAAVSGGPDSMCMLHVLLSLSQTVGFELYCAHVNHLLRAEESDADEELVRDFAQKNDIPFYTRRIAVAVIAEQNKQSIEDAARRLRYAFLFETADEAGACKIAVAHNKNDQAETMLMRFIRGSGAGGLSGIALERKDGVIRPILGCTREQVEEYCADNNVPFRIDRTNACVKYARNRIRHELLPLLQKDYNPAVIDALARTADILQVEEEFWQKRMDALSLDLSCFNIDSRWEFEIKDNWTKLALAEKRRWVLYVCGLFYGEPRVSFAHIRAIVELADGSTGKRIDLPDGLLVLRVYDKMVFTCQKDVYTQQTKDESTNWSANGKVLCGEGTFELECGTIIASITSADDFTGMVAEYSGNRAILDYDAIKGDMQVRFRKSGDRFRPFGLNGSVKLKDYFINKKIPQTQRSSCPLVCSNNEIIWVVGCAIADEVKISSKTSRYLLMEYRSNREAEDF